MSSILSARMKCLGGVIAATVLALIICRYALAPPGTSFHFPVPVQTWGNDASLTSVQSQQDVARAILEYRSNYGRLPPAAVTDKTGRPLLSWRVLVAPYLPGIGLRKPIKFDEPWDGPNNKLLIAEIPRCFDSIVPSDPTGWTRCKAFLGPGTPFDGPGLPLLESITAEVPRSFPAGPRNTLLVAETGNPVPWTKPEDLRYDSGMQFGKLGIGLRKPVYLLESSRHGLEIGRVAGFAAGFADGSSRFIPVAIDEAELRSLITGGNSKVQE